MNWKKCIAILLILIQLPLMQACMQTVTNYKTETVPVTVTKYRTVQKPVEKEVQVPYEETVKTPQYRVLTTARLNPTAGVVMPIAFLPFSSSTGNPYDGVEIAGNLERAVSQNSDAKGKYDIVSGSRVARTLGKTDISKLTAQDIKTLNTALGLEAVISGHVKTRTDNQLSFRVEGISTKTLRFIFAETITGEIGGVLQRALELFFGKRVLQGYKTETVTKYRTESQTAYEDVTESYEETEYQKKEVPYETKEIDWLSTLLLGVLVALLAGSSSDSSK